MKKLLFVEDERDLTEYLYERLNETHFFVSIAEDAPSAIEELSKEIFDVVILDLKYNGFGSAYDILSFIKRNFSHSNIEIYISTAYLKDGHDLVDDFSPLLSTDHLFAKPNGFFELLEKLEGFEQVPLD